MTKARLVGRLYRTASPSVDFLMSNKTQAHAIAFPEITVLRTYLPLITPLLAQA